MLHLLLNIAIETVADVNTDTPTSFTEFITPYLPILGIIVGGIIVSAYTIWNRRRGAVEQKAPEVSEIWKQQASQSVELDIERRLRRRLETFAYELKRVFIAYVFRVQGGGTVELNHHEQKYFDSDPPTKDIEIQKHNQA